MATCDSPFSFELLSSCVCFGERASRHAIIFLLCSPLCYCLLMLGYYVFSFLSMLTFLVVSCGNRVGDKTSVSTPNIREGAAAVKRVIIIRECLTERSAHIYTHTLRNSKRAKEAVVQAL